MTETRDKNLVGPGGTIALGAAALVLNLTDLLTIAWFGSAMELAILRAFAMLDPGDLHWLIRDGTVMIVLSGSMVALSALNIPFLCKQFGEASAHAARIIANIGAIVWVYPCLIIFLMSHGSLTFSGMTAVLGLLGGASLQLFMGYRRSAALDLQSTATPIQPPSFIQSKTELKANNYLRASFDECASDGSTIKLPTAEEVKLDP